jgi:diguanylate cyclase (GGDEF)-like protein/PAS domain S-box-containing protein
MTVLQNPEIFRAILDGLQTGVCVLDREGKIIFWNQGAAHAVGYMQLEVIGRHYHEVMALQHDNQNHTDSSAACPLARIVHEGKPIPIRMFLRHKRGSSVPVLVHFDPLRNEHGSIVAVAASFDAPSCRSQMAHPHRSLPPLATRDTVTGVANHGFALFHLRGSLALFTDYHVAFGILRVKPVGLKHFRAAYGHEASDAILTAIAQTLSNIFRPGDLVGRWGEEEFLVILANCATAGVQSVHERTCGIMTEAEIHWWGERLSLAVSIGYTSVELGDTVDALLQRALCAEQPRAAARAVAGSSESRS